jgi:hypothetical protein
MNNKYLIGGALILFAVYLYSRRKKSDSVTSDLEAKSTDVKVLGSKDTKSKTFVADNRKPLDPETIKLFEAAIYNTRRGGARNVKTEEIDAKNRNDAYEKIRVLGMTKEFELWAKLKLALEKSSTMLIK